MSLPVDALRGTFLEEARELLAQMQGALVEFETSGDHSDTVRSVFRAAHTIKGSAGLFGLQKLVRFAHVVETLLETLRSDSTKLTPAIAAVLMEAHDEFDRCLEAIEAGAERDASNVLVERLNGLSPSSGAPVAAPVAKPQGDGPRAWRLTVRFGANTFRDGFDPLSLLRFLEQLGTVEHVTVDPAAIPADASFDPETCYLGVSVDLTSDAGRARIEASLDFVRDGSDISLVERTSDAAPVAAPVKAHVEAKHEDKKPHDEKKHDDAAPVVADRLVKVPAMRLDTLVDMVSELVIAGATAGVHATRTGDRPTIEAFASIQKLVAGIRDTALGLRMVQIGETFNRFRRVIREVSATLGKEVEVEIKGGDTELDKAMVERLADPLLHIVRNAIDHGLELPAVREGRGKPRAGKLWLEAFHQGGQIVIDVRDDGAGLNREKIRRKAIEKGLVSPQAELTDEQVDDLIFLPGFSSADQVTDVSGRGVGMDVVRRSIDQLRGGVEVLSKEGQGTTIRLRLPLTLAIIDGFLLAVGEAHFVVPSKLIRECLDFASLLDSAENHRLKLRGEAVPFVRLRELFELPPATLRRESVVIIEYGDRKVGIVVDRLLGVSQTVIKPLGPLFKKYEGIGGSTILGSGEVALIIDVPQLMRLASNQKPARVQSRRSDAQTQTLGGIA
jgi:two-component system chemotaxis sensor kinase CheA